jgi:hypothetical protein
MLAALETASKKANGTACRWPNAFFAGLFTMVEKMMGG